MEAGEIGVAADVAHVDGNLPDGLGAVDDGEDAPAAGFGADLPDGQHDAVHRNDMGYGDDARPRGHLGQDIVDDRLRVVGGHRNGGLPVFEFVARGGSLPAGPAAAVFLVGIDDLVALAQAEAVGEVVHADGGVLRQRDLLIVSIDQTGDLGSQIDVGLIT